MEISLCMIVRDEEETLARCLDSVKELVDEIIIVDTGSQDRTKEIAAAYGARIYDFIWKDNFSEARNFAFSKAEKGWCMWLDADDVLGEGWKEAFLRLKRELPQTTDVVMLPYQMGFDEKGRPSLIYYRERIVRNSPDFRFQGRVHEAVVPKGEIIRADIPVEHRKIKQGENLRNLKIYRQMEELGEEFSPRDLYYYGRELTAHGNFKKGREVLTEFLERKDGWSENKIDASRQLAQCFYGLGEDERALAAFFQGFCYDLPRGETCCCVGKHFFDRGQFQEAAYWYERALQSEVKKESGAFVNEECYGYLPAICLCLCYDRLGDWKRAEKYNRVAGKYRPDSEHYLYNLQYFTRKREQERSEKGKEGDIKEEATYNKRERMKQRGIIDVLVSE